MFDEALSRTVHLVAKAAIVLVKNVVEVLLQTVVREFHEMLEGHTTHVALKVIGPLLIDLGHFSEVNRLDDCTGPERASSTPNYSGRLG